MTQLKQLMKSKWEEDVAAILNRQIKTELYSSYVYTSLNEFFDRHDVSFRNVSKFFEDRAKRKQFYADKLSEYQNKRGGQIEFFDIDAPTPLNKDTFSIKSALKAAIAMEETANKQMLNMHASSKRHPDFQSFLEDFEHENVDVINNLKKLLTDVGKCGDIGLGSFLFEKLAFI